MVDKNIFKLVRLNRALRVFFILIFFSESLLDGGVLAFPGSLSEVNNINLSPVLMSPNNLLHSESKIGNVIRFSLLETLESILEGQDSKNISYNRFLSILKKKTLTEDNVDDGSLIPGMPWFFMKEAYAENENIFVECRLLYEGKLETYRIIFSLNKDPDGGFLIKGIFPEKKGKILSFKKIMIKAINDESYAESEQKKDLKDISLLKPSAEITREPGNVISEETYSDTQKKIKKVFSNISNMAGRSMGVSFFKKTILALVLVVLISFGTGINSNAALQSFYEPDYGENTGIYLENIKPETVRSISEFSERTGIDVMTLMSMGLTELNYKGVIEVKRQDEKERMTSKKGAVGAWQLMVESAEDINDYIEVINEMKRKGVYVGPLDQNKMRIIKEFGLEKGIDLKRIDHRLPEYEADYNRRGAALLLALNRYSLGRQKLVKNKRSKGWHFRIRGPDDEIGYDLDEVLILTHNCDIDDVKTALRKGGPKNYWKYLPGETQVFGLKIKNYRKVLEKEPYLSKFKQVMQKAFEVKRKVVKASKGKQDASEKEAFLSDNIRGFMNLFLVIILGWVKELSIFVTVVWRWIWRKEGILAKGKIKELVGSFPQMKNKTRDSLKGEVRVFKESRPEAKNEEIKYEEQYVPVYEPEPEEETRLKEAGVLLGPPIEKYTFYVTMDFCPGKEFERDKFRYSSRFDLRLVRNDNIERIVDYVLNDVSSRGIDPENVVVQLPIVPEEDRKISKMEELKSMGIRFITLDTDGYKGEFPDKEEETRYRENIYALMLLVRKISVDMNNPILLNTFRSLIKNYTIDGEDIGLFEKYIKAIVSGDVPELIKVVLIYKPMRKIVDDRGKRLDLTPLIFA